MQAKQFCMLSTCMLISIYTGKLYQHISIKEQGQPVFHKWNIARWQADNLSQDPSVIPAWKFSLIQAHWQMNEDSWQFHSLVMDHCKSASMAKQIYIVRKLDLLYNLPSWFCCVTSKKAAAKYLSQMIYIVGSPCNVFAFCAMKYGLMCLQY